VSEPIPAGSSDDAAIARATNYLSAGRPAEATTILAGHLATNPQDVAALILLAAAQRELGQLALALETARQASSLAPDQDEAWSSLAIIELEAGALPGALDAIDRALNLNPDQWRHHAVRAATLRLAGNPDQVREAVESAQTAVRLAPDQPAGHIELGYALLASKRRSQAKAAFGEALRLAPADAEAQAGMAAVKFARWDYHGASQTFAQALQENPLDEVAQRNLVAAVAEMARVAGLIAIVAIVVATQLERQAAYLVVDGRDTWTSLIPAVIILLALPIYAAQVLRLFRSGKAQVQVLLSYHRLFAVWLAIVPIGLISLAGVFLLLPPSSTRTWISIPLLVITIYPGLIGVDRSRRMLARWDERILRPDSEGLDDETLSQRELIKTQRTIDQLTRSRKLLRATAGLVVVFFTGMELVLRSQLSDYATQTPGQVLRIGAALLALAVAAAVVVEIRLRRLARRAARLP